MSFVPILLLTLALSGPASALQQATGTSGQAQPQPAGPTQDPKLPTMKETVTVTATLVPVSVRDVPGTVSVIDAAAIDRGLMVNLADLVKFEPGVYIESNLTRIGLNGFNIRGIGGNRVMTQVDGVETSEQFDFGPFNVHQFALDLDTVKSAEIVRSAGSSLYGSDALGGVVSFFTKDPADYLRGRRSHVGAKLVFDGRSSDATGNVVVAGATGRFQASAFVAYGRGHEPRNRGTIRSTDTTRTALNPQDRQSTQVIGKLTYSVSAGNTLRASLEATGNEVDTEAYTSRTASALEVVSHDTMERTRVSLDQTIENRWGLNQWSWNAYYQLSDTEQIVDETIAATSTVPRLQRHGTLDYSQQTIGASAQGRKAVSVSGTPILMVFGAAYRQNEFDTLRDRTDVNAATGAIVPASNLILPTKYFPRTTVGEAGVYAQVEARVGRLTLRPGVRYDRFSLDADDRDEVFVASLSPAAVDMSSDAVSSRVGLTFDATKLFTVHAQYADGFRAPPYSAVNSGFTNLLGGYTSIPNPTLRPETSHNFEGGVRLTTGRVMLSATAFSNRYDDFILQDTLGFNPATGLLEFQYRNVSKVEIEGLEWQADARLTDALRLRASYAIIRGNDVSGDADVPLDSVAPDQGVLGLAFTHPTNRWGADVSLRGARAHATDRVVEGRFIPAAYAVGDVSGWVALGRSITLRGAVLNVTNEKYFEWTHVRGRSAADRLIDRYSSPGISGLVSLAYGW